jgi:hypothetical protein
MVKPNRISKQSRIKYFFLNNEPHRVLRISRSEDLVIAWNYTHDKRVTYVWSLTQGKMQKAFTIKEVCRIFNKNRLAIHDYIRNGKIRRPPQAHSINQNRTRPGKYLFSEDHMRELHSYLLTVHRGRPRNDGQVTNSNLMSRAELEALMKEDRVLYTKNKNGEYVPVWKQPDW